MALSLPYLSEEFAAPGQERCGSFRQLKRHSTME
jgi:hypothetical protein